MHWTARILRPVREHPCSRLLLTLWLEIAGRMCRQLICDYHLRKQVETRLTSIK